jgi:hypothetical protein
MVAEGHRLRDLQVREAGHDERGVAPGLLEQGALEPGDELADLIDLGPQPEAHVRSHLVVAGARGMQPLPGVADERRQPALDVEMHIFGVERPLEGSGLDLAPHAREPALDRGEVAPRQDAGRGEHARVSERAFDVILGEPPVEGDRCRKALDLLVDRLPESTRPAGLFFWHRIRLKTPT